MPKSSCTHINLSNHQPKTLIKSLITCGAGVCKIGFLVLCIITLVGVSGCTPRAHLSLDYGVAYKTLFSAKAISKNKSMAPITADDAKRILDKREQKGASKRGRGRRGRSMSRSYDQGAQQGLSSVFSME